MNNDEAAVLTETKTDATVTDNEGKKLETEEERGNDNEEENEEANKPEIQFSMNNVTKDTDIVNTKAEKAQIALEILADIKGLLQLRNWDIDSSTIIFEDKKKKDNKDNILFLGEDRPRREVYQDFTEQVVNILIKKTTDHMGDSLSENMEALEQGKKDICSEYMNLKYSSPIRH